jgi:plastocyanin
MPRTVLSIVVAAAAVLAWAGPTSAAGDMQILTGPTAKCYGYLTPVVVIAKGGPITYTNLDIERHNVVQDVNVDGVHGSGKRKWCGLFDKGRCPIFYSPLTGLGQSVKVRGLKYVKPGQVYTFYCTLHPGMKGKLVVQP